MAVLNHMSESSSTTSDTLSSCSSCKSSFLWNRRRWIMAFLLMYGMYNCVSNRSHIGVAMVCMVNASATEQNPVASNFTLEQIMPVNLTENSIPSGSCPRRTLEATEDSEETQGYKGTFTWSNEKQSLAISAGFYGNIVVMWFSGYLSDRFGSKTMALIGIFGMSVTAVLTPSVAALSIWAFVALRVFCGMCENPALPAMAAMLSRWFPAAERSTAAALYTSGTQLSASVGVVIASSLCPLTLLGGWPLIYYLDGMLGFVWVMLFFMLASDSPMDSKFLTEGEKSFLYQENEKYHTTFKQRKQTGQKLPLARMLLSKAVFAVVVTQMIFGFTNTLMQMYLPAFLRDVLQLDLKKNGVFTAVSFFVQLLSKNCLGIFADWLKKKKYLSPNASCHLFQALASTGVTISFLLLAFYINCSTPTACFIILAAYGGFVGASVPGTFTSSLSIAPSYSGMISSFTLISGALANALAPSLVGFIVQERTHAEWSLVFGAIAVINAIGGIVFLLCGTSDVQSWDRPVIVPIENKSPSHMESGDYCEEEENSEH
uniref:MFS domain-containing protein n=1 Tax=Panagrellus redivivus TaxID=6233 RepID=A0A7E4W365_PANRE